MYQTTAYANAVPRGNTFGRVAIAPQGINPLAESMTRADVGEVTWDEAIALYEVYCHASVLSMKTISERMRTLQLLRRFYGGSPAQITLAQLLAMQTRPLSPSTLQAQRSILQMFFRWLNEEGYASTNPAARLPKVRVPRRAPRPLTVSQVEAMLEHTNHRKTRTMILLGAYAGMRVAEIARIRGEMFDLESNQLTFIGKGGHQRVVDLHPILRAEIAFYPRRGYWFPSSSPRTNEPSLRSKSVSMAIHHAMRRAGINEPQLTAHSLRHFFATELLAGGVDVRVVQELMGHQMLNSTAIYTKVSDQRLREALGRMPEVTMPRTHYSRAHRRAWVGLADAAEILGVPLSTASFLAQDASWRYTAERDTLVYAVADVEMSRNRTFELLERRTDGE